MCCGYWKIIGEALSLRSDKELYNYFRIAPASNLIVPATPYMVETLEGLSEGSSPKIENVN